MTEIKFGLFFFLC